MTDNTEIKRANSRPLDVHRWSDHPDAKLLVDPIWSQYFSDVFQDGGKGNKANSSHKKQFKVLLLDLYVAWLEDPDMTIGVGMSKRFYKAKSRYNKLYISSLMIEIVRQFMSTELVDWRIGSELSKKTTRIRPTEKLRSYFKNCKLSKFELSKLNSQEVIVLNNTENSDNKPKTQPIEYHDTDFPSIPKMRQQLRDYNELLWKSFIDIPTLENPYIEREKVIRGASKLERIHLNQNTKFVRRIFYRGDWHLGGRFHGGWWQRVGEDWRRQIYINDESTVEQDYSGLHINLLYGLKGIQPEGDPYQLDLLLDFNAQEQRKIVKSLLLMSINATSPAKAFGAFRQKQPQGSAAAGLKDKKLQVLLDCFKEKHPDIKDSICSDRGVHLMNIDGRITSKVINYFTQKRIPILTIHDSYITQSRHTGLLNKVMNDFISEELNGLKIEVVQDGLGIDQVQAFRNQDKSNAEDYKFSSIRTYKRTKAYKTRVKEHKAWLQEYNK